MPTVLKDLDKNEEGNKLNSFSTNEKQYLQSLSVEEIKKQKNALGNEKFKVGDKYMNLSDIAKNYDTATGKVNGVKIEKKSDLAAAIQVYILANGMHISLNPHAYNNEAKGIDGIIGTNTKSGIDAFKNGSKSNDKPSGIDKSSFERCTIKGLPTYAFARVFDTIKKGKAAELKKMGVLDNSGCLRKYGFEIKNNSEAVVYYTSSVDKKSHSFRFKIPVNNYGEVDIIKFANEIINRIDNSEKAIRKETKENNIVSSVESFDIRQFSAKAQAYLKEKNFVSGNRLDLKNGIGTGIHFDTKGNLYFGNEFFISKDGIDSAYVNGKFNQDKFKSLLSPYLDRKANDYFKNLIHDKVDNLSKTKINENSGYTVAAAINGVDARIRYVKKIDAQINPSDEKAFNTIKQQFENIKDYKNVSKGMEQTLKDLVKNCERSRGTDYAKAVDALRRFSRLLNAHQRAWNGKNVYTVYSKIPDGAKKYEDLRKRAQAAADRTRQMEA